MTAVARTWSRQRVAAFRDRIEESRRIAEHVALSAADTDHQVVFEVVGLGGVGKSRFLGEVARRAVADAGAKAVSVSLSLEAALTSAAPLLAIRNELPADCWLFDTALLTYWAATDQPPQPVGTGGASLVMAMAPIVGPVPPGFGEVVFRELPADRARSRGYSARMFAEIDGLRTEPAELHARLPEYLGRDLHSGRRNPGLRGLLVLYDAYERQATGTVADGAPWLRSFIEAVGTGVHVVAARDPLGWTEQPWGAVQQIRLGPLPAVECRRLIRRELGELDRRVEDRLIETSGRLAFYLHASIDVCRAHIDEHGSVRADELPSSQPEAVEHLLDHLAPPERQLAVALAAVQHFDEPLYRHLARNLDLAAHVVGMNDFVEWFFVTHVDGGLYRTHDVLTEAVRSSAALHELDEQALQVATAHVAGRVGLSSAAETDRRIRLFHSLVAGWQALPSVPAPATELLVDIGYELFDAGYWDELVGLPERPAAGPAHPASLVASYFRALTTRRLAGPRRAIVELEPLGGDVALLGRHAASYEIELAYLRELDGDYASARRRFKELSERAVPFDPTDRGHVRVRLYHADMLTMDGQFAEASRLLLETYEEVGADAALMWAELVRHRGHALRFSLDFDGAERLYGQARWAIEAPGVVAKLATNLAETLCWSDPRRGLRAADEATESNGRLSSVIELAKVEAARGVALARLGEVEAGRQACDRALGRARQVGYPAAACFAHQARVVVATCAGDEGEADTAYRELVDGVEALDTYHHLCVIPAWLRRDEREVARWSSGVRWISPGELEARLASLRHD